MDDIEEKPCLSVHKNEIYFIIKLTENEHNIVEEQIKNYLYDNNYGEVLYYRKLKNRHIPQLREVKLMYNNGKVLEFLQQYKDNLTEINIENIRKF